MLGADADRGDDWYDQDDLAVKELENAREMAKLREAMNNYSHVKP